MQQKATMRTLGSQLTKCNNQHSVKQYLNKYSLIRNGNNFSSSRIYRCRSNPITFMFDILAVDGQVFPAVRHGRAQMSRHDGMQYKLVYRKYCQLSAPTMRVCRRSREIVIAGPVAWIWYHQTGVSYADKTFFWYHSKSEKSVNLYSREKKAANLFDYSNESKISYRNFATHFDPSKNILFLFLLN